MRWVLGGVLWLSLLSVRGVLEKELGLYVGKWTAHDEKGYVYGYPSAVDIDVAVRECKTILVEAK